jgi:hypothetical protein
MSADTQGLEGRPDDGLPEFHAAGDDPAGDAACSTCGYGVSVRSALSRCPMCGGGVWESQRASPAAHPLR